ncbi:hypothetical protein [Kribbella deserti]|uniref:Uncharacterized protein n=1 Tax=Kribbella deserti TaxID=1926257 RepID=A0ABV6QT55_9ACTN
MSTPREELHALIDALPESAAEELLTRLRLRAVCSERDSNGSWPPPWFGAGQASSPDVSERADEILREEFGRRLA